MSLDRPNSKDEAQAHIQEIQGDNIGKSDDLAYAAEMLRKGMFPERVRFFLELLQNAADAAETNDGGEVDIWVTDEAVIIQNDSRPFNKRDVEQLCGVGQSHKRFDPDYVGYWGFGFKSVYRITEQPYIASPPYFFKFDREKWDKSEKRQDNRGHSENIAWEITPIWIEPEDIPLPVDDIELQDKNTFILPIKQRGHQSYREEIVEDIRERIDDILKSELPLFLPGLKSVTIRDETEKEQRELGATIVDERANGQIARTEDGTRWWIFRETHEVPDSISDHPETEEWNREAVESREIVIGIGINKEGRLEDRQRSPRAAIYSFTPLGEEAVGLPFLLQGDFLAEAGRRSAERDARWNHWLAEKAGETVVRAAQNLLADEQWRVDIYDAVIPDRKIDHRLFGGHEHIDAWDGTTESVNHERTEWAGTDAVILEWFKNNPTILTESGELHHIDDIRYPDSGNIQNAEERIRDLITPGGLQRLDNAHFVADEVQSNWKARVEDRLSGVDQKLHVGTIRGFIKDNPEWLEAKAAAEGAEWFVKLYSLLEEEIRRRSDSTQRRRRKELENVSLVLTEDGIVAPSDESSIVIPIDTDAAQEIIAEIGTSLEAKRVPPEIVDDKLSCSFLKRFDISEIDAEWAVVQEVLPILKEEITPDELVVRLTPYVKEHIEVGHRTRDLRVATKDGGTAIASEVCFGDPYETIYDVESIFEGRRQYLSPEYRDQYDWDEEWREFFEELGVVTPGNSREDVLEALAALPASNVQDAEQYAARLYRLLLTEFASLPGSSTVEQVGGEYGLRLLVEGDGFHPADELYIVDDDSIGSAFAESKEIRFVWTPSPKRVGVEEDSRVFELLERLGANSISEECEIDIFVGDELEDEEDQTPRDRLQAAWDRIKSETGVNKPVPNVVWVEETGQQYRLGDYEQVIESDYNCTYDSESNVVYLTPNFAADWEALAAELADSLGGRKLRISTILQLAAPTLEDRAVDAIRNHEQEQGFDEVKDVRHDDYYEDYKVKGSDLLAIRDSEVRYIEIKARREQNAVRLIGNEPEQAEEQGDQYLLYVVVCSNSGVPEYFHRIRNPASEDYISETAWRFNPGDFGEKVELE